MEQSTWNNTLVLAEDVTMRFGGIAALKNYTLDLHRGELLGLIGPNGAGKTTVFNLLSGVIHPTMGRIYYNGQDITYLKPHKASYLGIARTFQNIRLFEELSVLENIKVAFHVHHGRGVVPTLLHLPSFVFSEREIHEKAVEKAALLHLDSIKDERAKNLSYGEQRRVELARALSADPELLLLDEPTAGLTPHETTEMMQLISSIHTRQKLTTILVEHDMKVIMGICRKIQVLDQGRVLALDTPEEIKGNTKVIEAYLGKPRAG
ncbi:MAG: ABC transporter ATP-binding protein [Spirochaetota bacterium]